MPFVKRDANGIILAVSQVPDTEFSEEIDSQDAQLLEFLNSIADGQMGMADSDIDFVRVVEDIVDLLVAKNYILFTELPEKAQEKIRVRQELRGKMTSHRNIIADEDDGFF